jgi:hypothetical protein
MEVVTQLQSCFIAASLGADSAALRALLAERRVQVRDALSLPSGQGSIVSTIEEAIRQADFVCAVLPPQPSPNVLFEIGLAYGARKPLFLIVEPGAELPADLRDLFYVRAAPSDAAAIGFNLDLFLRYSTLRNGDVPQANGENPGHGSPAQSTTFRATFRAKLEVARHADTTAAAFMLEELVAELFRQAQVVTAQEERHQGRGADLAIWLDGIESTIGNPVLVKVKAGTLSEATLRAEESRLRGYISGTNARAGMLVYLDREGRRFPASEASWPLVIRLDARDLAEIAAEDRIVRLLVTERNKAAHGVR